MNGFKVIAAIGCIALFSTILAPRASADAFNRKTKVTFTDPVEIPGVHLAGWGVLPPGTYVFKILDSMSDRHIVQIFDKNETTIYATILAIPNYRLKATGKTVITFRERPAGQPDALRAWFSPGRNWGEEFVYPKSKAVELAKAAKTFVLFTPVELPLETDRSIKSTDEPVVTELKKAPIMAVKPTGEEVQLAEAVTPLPDSEVASAKTATAETAQNLPVSSSPVPAPATTLPATASPLPLIGFLGLMALGAALTIRAFARPAA